MTVTELHSVEAGAPTTRWVPRRAGILNVWRYYDEVFEFHRGRLLLRGANGSGKSKALELLLPFLFDASLRAQRLSTFGTSERTMHWNLMGDGATGTTRVGYVWMEFSIDAGEPGIPGRRWFVCGARLQASAHTSSAHADYFTLHRRVDDGEFTTAGAQPLTRAALVERLGVDGTVHPGPTEHRAAVREVLFGGLSEQRYESLLLALLQLRMPKLSQRLDPSLLSTLLSRALPPLGEAELAELAEGFERLDRQREALERLDAEVAAAQRLAARQQGYARRVLRATAARLISATSEMDGRTRTARECEEALGSAGREVEQAGVRFEQAEGTARATETDIEALRSRSDYQQGAAALRQLDDKRAQSTIAERAAAAAAISAVKARRQATADAATAATALRQKAVLTGDVDELGKAGLRAADRARLGTVHVEVGDLALGDRHRARYLLDGAIGGRHGEIAAVRKAIDQHTTAVDRRGYAEEAVEEARETLSTALTVRTSSEGALHSARRERADRLSGWAARCRELQLDAASVAAAVDDERALDAVVAAAVDRATGDLATAEATAVQRRRVVTAERDTRAAELAAVRAQRHVPPQAPATRTADRATAAGAPLWQVVDFVDGLPAVDAAAVEAALQAGGLLDAWVGPAGVASVEGHDVRADPAHLAPAPGRSLADVLRPEENTLVPVERIRELLRVIAFDERLPTSTTSPAAHPAAVGADGSWRLGPVTGSWAKAEPEHIGATARARARERRIAELVADVERSEVALAELASDLRGIAGRRVSLTAEQASRPDRDALDAAISALASVELAVAQAEKDTARWVGKLAAAAEAVAARMRELTAVAARTGLPTRLDELDQLARAVDDYRSAAGQWLDRCGELAAARDTAVIAGGVAERSVEAATEREEAAEQQEEIARELGRAVATLEGSIGQAYHEIADRIAALRTQRDTAREAATVARAAKHKLELLIVTLENRADAANEARDSAIAARDVAGERMRALGGGTLVADAGAELPVAVADGVRATLDSARAVAARWAELPHEPRQIDQALARLAEELHGARDVLGVRADLALESEGEHQVLVAVAGGIRTGAAGLLEVVRSEAQRAREDITAAERELFDTTLTGDTRRHLADRIRQARALVDGMNERLREVRTASRVAVQLVWQVDPDLPASAQIARELLLRNPARLSDADRDALHRFFRDRVDQARATDSSQSWEQQLGEVFDYTSWHRFVVKVDRGRGEGWQLLTRKLHGALSGGEKALALHLPLFAAVAAHYESVRQAPRLILLDEVFVGVDVVNRGQVFALLASLDLDLVLTSDHEWCAYSELDGIAVHQLVTGDDSDDAVTTARFVWTGEDWLPSDEAGEP